VTATGTDHAVLCASGAGRPLCVPRGRPGARGPVRSVYVRDPDGSLVAFARLADRRPGDGA
jgi:catechol 2,3-dioxygenase-like lactoylglutathione lyase family enzyme